MQTNPLLPTHVLPADLAAHFGVSERTVRSKLRAIGAYATLGNKMLVFPQHVEMLKEAMTCPSRSTSVEKSGTCEAPLRGATFEKLQERLTERRPNASRRKSKAAPGNVVSMGRGRG